MNEDYNLYPLHVFRLVARHGSVTRAAQALCISQLAVSGRVRALEARYGGPLFERTPRGMLLTPAGTALAEGVERLLAQVEDLGGAVEAARGRVRGEVAVAASSTPGAYLLPGLLRRFRDRYPETQPTLIVGDTAEVLARLHDYSAPLGVVGALPGTVEEGDIHREQIAADELRLVAAAGDPLCEIEAVGPEHLGRPWCCGSRAPAHAPGPRCCWATCCPRSGA
jgi:DNA-binding transcriptional LysR family regulator